MGREQRERHRHHHRDRDRPSTKQASPLGHTCNVGARALELESRCFGRLALVLGEQEAVVLEVRPWDVHGVGHVDVTVVYPDLDGGKTARLGRERKRAPKTLPPGDDVLVAKAMNVVVEVRRPGA